MIQAQTDMPDSSPPSDMPAETGSDLPDNPLDHAEPGSLHHLVLKQLDDDQAQEMVSIPLAGKSSIADHMIIASGRSTRQVASMAQKLAETVKQAGHGPVRLEGLPVMSKSVQHVVV